MAPKGFVAPSLNVSLHQNGHANTHQNGHQNFANLTQSQFTSIQQNMMRLETLVDKFQMDSTTLMETMRGSVAPQQINTPK
jgi:hypothetical protein